MKNLLKHKLCEPVIINMQVIVPALIKKTNVPSTAYIVVTGSQLN